MTTSEKIDELSLDIMELQSIVSELLYEKKEQKEVIYTIGVLYDSPTYCKTDTWTLR